MEAQRGACQVQGATYSSGLELGDGGRREKTDFPFKTEQKQIPNHMTFYRNFY